MHMYVINLANVPIHPLGNQNYSWRLRWRRIGLETIPAIRKEKKIGSDDIFHYQLCSQLVAIWRHSIIKRNVIHQGGVSSAFRSNNIATWSDEI